MAKNKSIYAKSKNGATLGFEQTLWLAADKLRNNMDAAEYKHVVLGLIFLKYISDAFQERYDQLKLWTEDPQNEYYAREESARYEVLEDKDEYTAENYFWVPLKARWSFLQGKAKQPEIGKLIDDAMSAIEQDNPVLKGVLPKDYARPTLDKQRLGELIDLIGTIGLGDKENRSKDVLGRVYEYFLSQFASAEGKKGGQFYTPRYVVRVLVEMLAPNESSRIYDPCCGSGGMFIQSEKFVEQHSGKMGKLSIFGQESNPTTWKLAKMNLAIRGIEGDLGKENADSFHKDLHPDLKADYVLANPPFNSSDWGGERLKEDKRWVYGIPPKGNANFGWVQHFIHHLAPNGIAGFVLANGSMSSNTSGEGDIRKAMIEADIIDCMVALPGQLFYSTQIPVCLWFVARNKHNGRGAGGNLLRDRSRQTLFIDARKMGSMTDRVHRELTDEEIAKIADTYHAWRGDGEYRASGSLAPTRKTYTYNDVPGFCKSASTEEIAANGYILTPGRYVGMAEEKDDGESFNQKMYRLKKELYQLFDEDAKIIDEIKSSLQQFTENE